MAPNFYIYSQNIVFIKHAVFFLYLNILDFI